MNGLSDRIGICAVGEFGDAVIEYLADLEAPTERLAEGSFAPGSLDPPDSCWLIVLISGMPKPLLCPQIEEYSRRSNRPFAPLIFDAGTLRLGPVTIPGKQGCWSCWLKRTKQHLAMPLAFSALYERYSSESKTFGDAFLEPHALLAASWIFELRQALTQGTVSPGLVKEFNCKSRKLSESVVVGVHDCEYCGLHMNPTTRGYADLHSALSYLWTSYQCDVNAEGGV